MIVKVAMPRLGNDVAPCFEYSATISIITFEDGVETTRRDFSLQSRMPYDRVRLLRDQGVNVLICGGVQNVFERMVRANGIEVISWVSGDVDELVGMYLNDELVPGTSRLT